MNRLEILFAEFLATDTFDKMIIFFFLVLFLGIQLSISRPRNVRQLILHAAVFALLTIGTVLGVTKLSKSRDAQDAYIRSLYQSCLNDGRPDYECRAIVYYPGGRR